MYVILPSLRESLSCKKSLKLFPPQTVYFDWDEATQGIILGSFYYGYVLTHVPGGMLSERYGGKWLLGLGLLSTAICTIITPVVVKAGGASALIGLRIVEGLGEVSPSILFYLFRQHTRLKYDTRPIKLTHLQNVERIDNIGNHFLNKYPNWYFYVNLQSVTGTPENRRDDNILCIT